VSDYHLHLHPHSPRADSPPAGVYPHGWIDRYVEAAAARGVTELGFTEHLYRCVESMPIFGRWWDSDPSPILRAEMEAIMAAELNLSLDRYVEVVLDAKARGLPVKLGLEVDFHPGTEHQVADLLAGYPFDYLIGSVHWIGAWDFARARAPAEFARRGVERAWREYFALESALAEWDAVDVLAHADMIKHTGFRPEPALIAELYGQVVENAARTGKAVEVSSAGLRSDAKEIYPAPAFLSRFFEAGVPITLASDAHMPEFAGWGHEQVLTAARAAGYTSYLRFEDHERRIAPIPQVVEDSG
jgi:histidinol-phosphatase (PHP family)